MRDRHFRTFDSKISFFAFADIITAVSGMLIFITLLLATDLGRPTDHRSQAASSELERQLKETLIQQAQADAENHGLQHLLTAANTAPAPDKLELDIARLRAEIADEKSKHAGMDEQLAASQSELAQRDKLLGITAVREQLQESDAQLEDLARQDDKIQKETAALENQIKSVHAKTVKLHAREGQTWLIPERSATSKEPILVIVSGKELRIERFDRPDLAQHFDKSSARSKFQSFLRQAKPTKQYIVFLIRPSGIGLFKDVEKMTRDNGFEMGFDALEENREIHFTTPPPIEDEIPPGSASTSPIGPRTSPGSPGGSRSGAGSPGTTEASAESGVPGSTGTANSSVSSAGPPGSTSTNISATSGTNTANVTNAAANGNSTNTTNAANTSSTNSAASSKPPPPPKPKSWWQRLLEWLGIE